MPGHDPQPPSQHPQQPSSAQGGRLRRALLQPTRSQVLVAVVLAVFGFAIVTQVRSNTVDDTYAGLREQELIDILNGLADTTQRANAEIQRLEATRDDLTSETRSRTAALEAAQSDLDALSILAGTVPVTGPGLSITIEELAGPVRVEPFIDMVQALRAAGAEAMVINGGVRVVASTSFQDVTGGLLVGGQLLTAPYTVEVIGSPEVLAAALRFPNGPQDQFEKDGQGVLTYEEVDRLELRAVHQIAGPGFAESAVEQ